MTSACVPIVSAVKPNVRLQARVGQARTILHIALVIVVLWMIYSTMIFEIKTGGKFDAKPIITPGYMYALF